MADITEERKNIQVEETKPQAALSESLMTRLGAAINFVNKRQLTQHDFNLLGCYNIVEVPNNGIDGFITYPFAFEIYDIQVMSGDDNGTSGTTELDLKWAADGSTSFASIFSTTPKFTSAAAAFSSIRPGQTVTGWTAPVLSKTTFAAYDKIRLDLLQAVAGDPQHCYVKLFIRPI